MTTPHEPTPGHIARLVASRLVTPLAAVLVVIAVSATSDARVVPLIRAVAVGFIVVALLLAFIPKRLDVRTHGCVSLSMVAVAVMGLIKLDVPYEVTSALFAVAVLVTLRAPLVLARIEAARRSAGVSAGPRGMVAPDHVWWVVVMLAVAGGLMTTALLLGLPPASAMAERQVQRMSGNIVQGDDQIGFSTTLRVGALRNALRSDRVVMRVKGEESPYLRGVVLDRYDRRIWSGAPAKKTTSVPADAAEELATTHIEMSRTALSARTPEPRWFLPADACDIHTASGRMALDPFGMAHPEPLNDTRVIAFRHTKTSSCRALLPAGAQPAPQDLGIADKVRSQLGPAVTAWTSGKTDRQALESIIAHLARYEYSLDGPPDGPAGHTDPVVQFVFETKRGHCELFASAMALIARTAGIPARIVVGYHVDEINPVTGMSVVRDRNAHTWVEAWVDGKWEAFDPTPSAELLASTRPTKWEHFTEALSFAWDSTINFFVSFGLKGAGISSAILAVVLLIVRRFMQRGTKKKTGVVLEVEPPLPAFETLAAALARAGWPRSASEPLEIFAQRVVNGGEPWSSDVADVLARYAELRYGGIGEEGAVAQRLDEVARRVPASV